MQLRLPGRPLLPLGRPTHAAFLLAVEAHPPAVVPAQADGAWCACAGAVLPGLPRPALHSMERLHVSLVPRQHGWSGRRGSSQQPSPTTQSGGLFVSLVRLRLFLLSTVEKRIESRNDSLCFLVGSPHRVEPLHRRWTQLNGLTLAHDPHIGPSADVVHALRRLLRSVDVEERLSCRKASFLPLD